MAKPNPLEPAAQKLIEAWNDVDELVRLKEEDGEVKKVLRTDTEWRERFEEQVKKLTPMPLSRPPTEVAQDEEPPAPEPPDEPFDEPSDEPAPGRTDEEDAPPGEQALIASAERADEPKSKEPDGETAAPEAPMDIFKLALRTQQRDEEFSQAMRIARQALGTIFSEQQIQIAGETKFIDPDTGYEKQAFEWLIIQIAKGEMTAEEATTYARGQEDWVTELLYRRDWIRQIQEIVRQAGEREGKDLELVFWIPVNERHKVDLRIKITEAIQAGELTIEKAAEMALATRGWTREKEEEKQRPSSRHGRGYSRSGSRENGSEDRQQHRQPPPGTQRHNSQGVLVSG